CLSRPILYNSPYHLIDDTYILGLNISLVNGFPYSTYVYDVHTAYCQPSGQYTRWYYNSSDYPQLSPDRWFVDLHIVLPLDIILAVRFILDSMYEIHGWVEVAFIYNPALVR